MTQTVGRRVGKLVKDLALSAINATLFLVIVALIAGIILFDRVDGLRDEIAAGASDRVVKALNRDAGSIVANLKKLDGDLAGLRKDVRALTGQLEKARSDQAPLSAEDRKAIDALRDQIARLDARVARVMALRDVSATQMLRQIGRGFAEALGDEPKCPTPKSPVPKAPTQ